MLITALNFIKPLGPLNPVVLQGIRVFELLPGSALVRAMNNGEVGEEVILHANLECLMRNRYVKPILLGVEFMEVKTAEKFWGQEGTAKTEVFLFFDHLVFLSLGIFIGVVDFARIVDGYAGCNGAVVTLCRSVVKPLKGIGRHHHIAFYNKHGCVALNAFLLHALEHQEVIGRRVRSEVVEVYERKSQLLAGNLKALCIFRSGEIVVNRVGKRHSDM